MTLEQRTLIGAVDIFGIEYSCGNCQTKCLTPIKEFKKVVYQCPNCKQGVVSSDHPDSTKRADDAVLHNFVEALLDLQSRNIGIKLQVSPIASLGVPNGS